MNHPSSAEFFEFIDRRLSGKRAREIAAHVSECVECRKRAALERSTREVVRSESIVKAPAGLSSSIMVNLGSPARDSFVLKVLGKFGAVVATMIVLTVIGLVIARVSDMPEFSEVKSSRTTDIFSPLSDPVASGMQTLVDRSSAFSQTIEAKATPEFWKTLCFVILTLGVLAGADRVFGKRFIKLRS
jgi:Putative zinc-finger